MRFCLRSFLFLVARFRNPKFAIRNRSAPFPFALSRRYGTIAPFIPSFPKVFAEFYLSPKAKAESTDSLALRKIAPLIHDVRGERVIFDSDLARIYGVSAKALNQAVKRNAERFPEDFAFRLIRSEFDRLRSQFVTSNDTSLNRSQFVTSKTRGGRRYLREQLQGLAYHSAES